MNVKIDDYDYHARMLFDIATRRHMPILLAMMTDTSSGKTLRCVNGAGDDVIMLFGMMIAELERKDPTNSIEELIEAVGIAAKIAHKSVIRGKKKGYDEP